MTNDYHMPITEITQGNGHICMQFGPDEYRHFLEDYNLTPQQEEELLYALWIIIKQFVDMGFGIDPVQLVLALTEREDQAHGDKTEG